MTAAARQPWTARLAWSLLLLLVGAGLTIWGLSRWDAGARFFGVAPPSAPVRLVAPVASPAALAAPTPAPAAATAADVARLAALEARLQTVEGATRRAEGSAGRADSLLIAFSARRAMERGLALGYLEPLLADRFGPRHQGAVATLISAGRKPQTLDQLIADYQAIGPILQGPGKGEDWWTGLQRELGSLVSVHRADRANPMPGARYARALDRLRGGKVAEALAETMRMPGASRPEVQPWIGRARQRIAVDAALDQIESEALVGETEAR